MQTAGELLKQARLKKKLTFTKVSKLTKISSKTLRALEKNQFDRLPPSIYIKGFIQNYAQIVNLDPKKTIAIFKRDYSRQKHKKIVPSGLSKPLNSPWQPSTRVRTFIAVSLIAILLLAYLGIALFKLYQPPKLVIFQPDNGLTASNPILIKGQTNHDATLTLNGKTVNLESDGSFTTVFNGHPGTAELKFKAISRRQKATDLDRYVIITE